MKVFQSAWSGAAQLAVPDAFSAAEAHLLLVTGPRDALDGAAVDRLRAAYPKARIVGCSGAGEILDTEVSQDRIILTAVHLDKARVELASVQIGTDEPSDAVGRRLVAGLPAQDLVHVMVFSDGLHVNGSPLVDGMTEGLPEGVTVTGGLAGDGDRFEHTVVLADGPPLEHQVAAIGFYGGMKVGFGSLGGWDPFGPLRRISRSDGNVLYELDGRPALDLYKEYLGEHAAGLPATGLLFPLYLPAEGGEQGVVRTILAVDEDAKSLTFAGDVPEGAPAQLMKANFDRLVDGAQEAAERSHDALGGGAELAVLISCVGRRLVLKQRVEDELDAVRQVIGPQAAMAGFYSYGEICPSAPGAGCRLHNQTMTITTLREA